MHWKIFCIHIFLLISVVNGNGVGDTGTTKFPLSSLVLTYTCSPNDLITITDVSNGDYNHIQVLKTGVGKIGFCKRSADTKDALQNCITKNTEGGTAYLLYQLETNRELVAGQQLQYVALTCDKTVETKEVTLELNKKFSTTAGTPDWTTLSPVQDNGHLSLSITPDDGLYVGQELTLTMTLTGTTDYIISPLHCDATRKSKDTLPSVQIWDCKSLADTNIISEALWQSVNAQKSVSIHMFAFKFVDSENVFIKCTANVCPTGNPACNLDACTGHNRKRRGLNNSTTGLKIPVEHASVYMKVKDPILNRSSGLSTIWYAHFVPVLVMISSRLYL